MKSYTKTKEIKEAPFTLRDWVVWGIVVVLMLVLLICASTVFKEMKAVQFPHISE